MNLAPAIIFLAAFLALWFFLFWVYQDFKVDSFRQKMFSIRDEMFDAALAGEISFDDKLYGMTRIIINGFIRYAHRLSLIGFLAYQTPPSGEQSAATRFHARVREGLDEIDEEKKLVYRKFMCKMHVEVVRHVFLSSPILAATLVVPVAVYLMLRFCIREVLEAFEKPLLRVDSLAYVEGEPSHIIES